MSGWHNKTQILGAAFGLFSVSIVSVGTAKPSSCHGADSDARLSVVSETCTDPTPTQQLSLSHQIMQAVKLTCGGAGWFSPSAGSPLSAGQ